MGARGHLRWIVLPHRCLVDIAAILMDYIIRGRRWMENMRSAEAADLESVGCYPFLFVARTLSYTNQHFRKQTNQSGVCSGLGGLKMSALRIGFFYPINKLFLTKHCPRFWYTLMRFALE